MPGTIHNTHILVAKHKFKIRALKGNPPPTKPLPQPSSPSASPISATPTRTLLPGRVHVREPRALVRGGCGLRRRARSRADLSYVNTTNGFGITKRSSGSSSGCSGRPQAAAVATRKPGSRLRLAQGGGSVLGEVWISAARGRLADEQLARGRCTVDLQREGSLWHLGARTSCSSAKGLR